MSCGARWSGRPHWAGSATPQEVAAAVLFLASPAAACITGKILEVDRGLDGPNLDFGIPDL